MQYRTVVGNHRGRRAPHAGKLRLCRYAHLASGVVEVVLARDVVSAGVEEVGDGVAEDGVAAVADGQGSGWVGGHVLDEDASSVAGGCAAVVGGFFQDLGEGVVEVLVGEAEVPLSDKANAEKGSKSWLDTRRRLESETVFSTIKRVIRDHREWDPTKFDLEESG